jgi:hypothetical protein
MMRGGRVIHDVLDDMIPVTIVVTTNGSAEDTKTVYTYFSANIVLNLFYTYNFPFCSLHLFVASLVVNVSPLRCRISTTTAASPCTPEASSTASWARAVSSRY